MKKKLFLVALVWYFGIRFETETEGIFISAAQGPYKTERECKIGYRETVDQLGQLFPDLKTVPCKEMKGTEL